MATPGNRLANLTQLKISGTLVNKNNSFPVLLPEDIRGSIRHVDNYNELLSINSVYIEPGQLAYVKGAITGYPSGYYFVEDLSALLPATRQNNGTLINYKWSRFGLSSSSIVKIVDFEDENTVTVAHNFGYNPTVVITDSTGEQVEAKVIHMNDNACEIYFNGNKTGKATLK
jgi:hypothetical protein